MALKRVALVVGGLVVGLLASEGVARLMDPSGGAELLFNAPDAMPSGLYTPDPVLRKVPTPGFSGELAALDYRVPIEINSLGLRGPEPGGSACQVVVGDSFALSLQVPLEQTFEAHAERALGCPVWNAGVDGYSTWQASGRYARLADDPGVDGVVLLYFLGNDWNDNTHLTRGFPDAPAPPVMEPPPMEGSSRWLFQHSAIYAHVRVAKRRQQVASGHDIANWRGELSLFHEDGDFHPVRDATRDALKELRDFTASKGDELVVLVAPPAFQIHSERAEGTMEMVGLDPARMDLDRPRRELLGILDELGMEACDPTDDLLAAGEDVYFRYDGHWNARGHQIVGERLAACLE